MLKKLFSKAEARLAIAVAAGAFVALVAYRAAISIYDWWTSLAGAPAGYTSQSGVALCVVTSAGIGAGWYVARVAFTAYFHGSAQRKRWIMQSCILSIASFALLLSLNAAGNPSFFPWLAPRAVLVSIAVLCAVGAAPWIRGITVAARRFRRDRKALKLANYSDHL